MLGTGDDFLIELVLNGAVDGDVAVRRRRKGLDLTAPTCIAGSLERYVLGED